MQLAGETLNVWNEYSNNGKHKWGGAGYLMSDSQGFDSEKVKSEDRIDGLNKNETFKAQCLDS